MDLYIALICFPVIFIGELPDKTMFASLVMATKGRPRQVWLGAAAAFLPNLMPKLGESLRPAMKSTVRASYKFAQKTREVFAEASEQMQDMVAEAKVEQEPAAQPVANGARKQAPAAAKA